MPITEEDFAHAAAAAKNLDTQGFDLCLSRSDLRVWWRELPGGCVEFRAVGIVGLRLEALEALVSDVRYRKKWDPENTKKAKPIPGERNKYYWMTRYSWPTDNREYYYEREHRVLDGMVHAFISKSCDTKASVRTGCVRATGMRSMFVFWPGQDASTSKFVAEYEECPGKSLSASTVQQRVLSSLPEFIASLQRAATKHQDFLQNMDKRQAFQLVADAMEDGLEKAFSGF